jgi:type IV pilus assembly protein PilA
MTVIDAVPSRRPRMHTLLELIVVIVILGILAALTVPTFVGVITKSREAVLKQNATDVYRQSQALVSHGTAWPSSGAPVSEQLTTAATMALVSTMAPASAGHIQLAGDGAVVVWAANGTLSTPGLIESYSTTQNLCYALSVPAFGLPTPTACPPAGPSKLPLMAVLTPTGHPIGVVAPFVPNATSWTFSVGFSPAAPVTTPYVEVSSGPKMPTQVMVTQRATDASDSVPVVDISSLWPASDPGSLSISLSIVDHVTTVAATLSWKITDASAADKYYITRCPTLGCLPDLTSPIATAPATHSSYTDWISPSDRFSYQVSVVDSVGYVLTSNIVTVTWPYPVTTLPK